MTMRSRLPALIDTTSVELTALYEDIAGGITLFILQGDREVPENHEQVRTVEHRFNRLVKLALKHNVPLKEEHVWDAQQIDYCHRHFC